MTDIKSLETKILEAQDAYYNGTPIMDDAEFDALWDELKRLDPTNKILTAQIGEDHLDGFQKADHMMTMGSQSKANTLEDMQKFFNSTPNAKTYLAEFKMDGLSLELQYENGKFKKAITRGDGYVGDDVTQNVMKMNFVPKMLKDTSFTGPIRGETLLSRKNKEEFYNEMKNCRNAASGILKRLDGKGAEHLDVVVYEVQRLDGKSFGTQENAIQWLKDQGFKIVEVSTFKKESDIAQKAMDYLNEVFEDFDNLEYDIDGIVWKQNEIDMDDMKELRPSTQIALKPKRTIVKTKLLNIEWNCNNGTYTPIAILSPVDILGSTVQKASLSNLRNIINLDIEIGCEVFICKRGEIIPHVEGRAA